MFCFVILILNLLILLRMQRQQQHVSQKTATKNKKSKTFDEMVNLFRFPDIANKSKNIHTQIRAGIVESSGRSFPVYTGPSTSYNGGGQVGPYVRPSAPPPSRTLPQSSRGRPLLSCLLRGASSYKKLLSSRVTSPVCDGLFCLPVCG